jgi:hypothetical protein
LGPATDSTVIAATTLDGAPDAWKRGELHRILKRMVDNGLRIAIGAAGARRILLWDSAGQREQEMSEPDENGMQWRVTEK